MQNARALRIVLQISTEQAKSALKSEVEPVSPSHSVSGCRPREALPMRAEAKSRAAVSMDVSGFDRGSSEELSAAPPVAGSRSSISKGDSATRSRRANSGRLWRICRARGEYILGREG